jgi:hypothetical protein
MSSPDPEEDIKVIVYQNVDVFGRWSHYLLPKASQGKRTDEGGSVV